MEISYYSTLYGVFGTQAILIGGFTYGTFTQNNVDVGNVYEPYFSFFYFLWAAATIACSVHIMLSTMILQVYGPGLALHGPLGSMARATEGLRAEQGPVIVAFICMIISFAASTVCVFWTVMTMPEAIVCTAVFMFAARQWYYYSERIYLRFYWNKDETRWEDGAVDNEMELDNEPQIPNSGSSNPMHKSDAAAYTERKVKFPINFGIKNAFRSKKEKPEETEAASVFEGTVGGGSGSIADAKVDLGSTSSKGMIAMEGYFTTKCRTEQHIIGDAKRLERRYFVLFRTSEFYIYKTRQDFRTEPKAPIYIRPLRLIDFFVKVDNTDQELRLEFEDDSRSNMTDSTTNRTVNQKSMPLVFQITLIPRENEQDDVRAQFRNHWILRCDTEEELEIWLNIIKEVCPSCFREG